MTLTPERLREVLDYDLETGVFRWKANTGKRRRIGDIAGSSRGDPYIRISIDGKLYRAHRLVWLYMTGEWPDHEVDHRDLDKHNNRWLNLRAATRGQNKHNLPAYKNNTSGIKGVSFNKARRKWVAQITVNRVNRGLGYFSTPEEAAKAYANAAEELHEEFARTA